ncbi:hypothetical protein [Halococcus agarilyticus]|uniref:hypothetical protein n=1 Tax=Halococcus agarilyticus TaxID=1232219 RepID=UPI0006781485|nr:hypothetical protein [Halococcus agarilyticus]
MEILSRFRQPEHVGENRCTPCTVVNVGIAVVACGVLGLWTGGVGAMAFAACLAVIYLRGYLVPGTPTLTKRYLPDRVLRRFGKAPARSSTSEAFSPEELLMDADVIGPCEHADDLCLQPDFRTAWRDRIEVVRERDPGATHLERAIDDPGDDLTFETVDGNVVAIHDNATVGQWSSAAAIVADVAATDVLPASVSSWGTLTPVERLQLLGSLRLFLETCPACDGSVALGEEVVDSCCRSYDVVSAVCRGCDARVFEIEWT